MRKVDFAWIDGRRTPRLFLLLFAFVGLLLLPELALAQDNAGQDGLFDAKLSYSAWDLGGGSGSVEGWDGELCPPWWWPWPWPWSRPNWDFRISYYEIDRGALTKAIPLEFGLLIPISRSTRVTPYVGAGIGYYLLDGNAPGIGDEIGAYGVLGADIHLGRGPQPEPWGLNIEAAYREVGGKLDLGGPTFKAGLGFSF